MINQRQSGDSRWLFLRHIQYIVLKKVQICFIQHIIITSSIMYVHNVYVIVCVYVCLYEHIHYMFHVKRYVIILCMLDTHIPEVC